jgi:hypothetical protein
LCLIADARNGQFDGYKQPIIEEIKLIPEGRIDPLLKKDQLPVYSISVSSEMIGWSVYPRPIMPMIFDTVL